MPKIKRDTILEISLSSDFAVLRNLCRAGVLKNNSRTVISVPPPRPQSEIVSFFPPSQEMNAPNSCPCGLDAIFILATEAMLASASPRKPSVSMASRSPTSRILLVACGMSAFFSSSFSMPQPSSVILIEEIPPSRISTAIFFAPASMEFSTSSFTTENGLSTTSPAAIRL